MEKLACWEGLEACFSHPPVPTVGLFPSSLLLPGRLPPRNADMQRPGSAAVFLLEEVVEGQLPDSPVARSSRLHQMGPCGMP